MFSTKVQHNLISYSAVINAVEKGNEWKKVRLALNESKIYLRDVVTLHMNPQWTWFQKYWSINVVSVVLVVFHHLVVSTCFQQLMVFQKHQSLTQTSWSLTQTFRVEACVLTRTETLEIYRRKTSERLLNIWVFPEKWMVYKFIMKNPVKMDALGGTPIFGNIHILMHWGYPPPTMPVK